MDAIFIPEDDINPVNTYLQDYFNFYGKEFSTERCWTSKETKKVYWVVIFDSIPDAFPSDVIGNVTDTASGESERGLGILNGNGVIRASGASEKEIAESLDMFTDPFDTEIYPQVYDSGNIYTDSESENN